ncbi:hypothetical protein BOVATA_028830 [Babesia ovata]|uniref:Uncharacterized protein n=1 Tax=Babesia ovata TaxID=189622 RepID=A0A2H6KEG4_9APIC|nr:uncharacterized protein BOVATA_028830 [Babesia ovata]GBE61390.1 hypothetical protein BOVATA_028830 [Babesia ovata]
MTFKNIISHIGNVGRLKRKAHVSIVDATKLPAQYDMHKHISLHIGDWRRIKADCTYMHDESTLKRQLFLAQIYGHKCIDGDKNFLLKHVSDSSKSGFRILNVENSFTGLTWVSYGHLAEIGDELARQGKRSLLAPLDVIKHSDDYCLELITQRAKAVKRLERIVFCAPDDGTWNALHSLLKS